MHRDAFIVFHKALESFFQRVAACPRRVLDRTDHGSHTVAKLKLVAHFGPQFPVHIFILYGTNSCSTILRVAPETKVLPVRKLVNQLQEQPVMSAEERVPLINI